jgi:hypothetical protein
MKFTRPKISKKKIAVFSVFVFIATIFWFLNALNREYTTNIKYPVEFINIPKNISPAVQFPSHLNVTVKAYGFDILRKITVSKKIQIDVDKYSERDETDDSKLMLSTLQFKNNMFTEQNNIEIININPEIISINTQNLLSKKVPVRIKSEFTTQSLYMLSGPVKIYPDSLLIYGSEKMIKTIEYVETEKKQFLNLKDTLLGKLALKKTDSIIYEQEFVNLLIPIEKFTENTTEVKIKVINKPDSLKLLTFPKEVKVTYHVTLSRFKSVKDDDFTVQVDYAETLNSTDDKLQVKIVQLPDGIEKAVVYPNYVEYIIEKREENKE